MYTIGRTLENDHLPLVVYKFPRPTPIVHYLMYNRGGVTLLYNLFLYINCTESEIWLNAYFYVFVLILTNMEFTCKFHVDIPHETREHFYFMNFLKKTMFANLYLGQHPVSGGVGGG